MKNAIAPACIAAMLSMASCHGQLGDDGDTAEQASETAVASAAASPSPAPSASSAGTPVPEAKKGEEGARTVLVTWARALERKDFETAFAQFGEGDAEGGIDYTELERSYAPYRTITVAVPTGQMEGAAGSLYYTAPATITGERNDGTPYRLEGDIILRRVNDVPGASPEQLRWHIAEANVVPVD